jgi:hypothetical protein
MELLILETNLDNHYYRFYPNFEHEEDAHKLGFDKVIMQAGGGIGYGKLDQAIKNTTNRR